MLPLYKGYDLNLGKVAVVVDPARPQEGAYL